MSNPGPPEQPEQEQPGSGETGSGEPGSSGGQQWSPYPTGWDQPQPSTPPPPAYGASQDQPGSPYEQNPYGQQNPYGEQSPYQQAPYGATTPTNPYARAPRADRPVFGFGGYAGWFSRVGAYVIDYLLGLVAGAPAWVGYAIRFSNTTTVRNPDGTTSLQFNGSQALPTTLILIGSVTSLAFFIWNVCIRQGSTGATVGKGVLAIRLVNSDLQPIGGGLAFLRQVLHIVDVLPCCIPLGYLWPLWDERKQTFADKIMSTYVIHATQEQPKP